MTIKPPPPPPSPAKPQRDATGRFLPGHDLSINNAGNPKGQPRKFKTPEELWEKFLAYRESVEASPLQEEVHSFYKGVPKKTNVAKMRAMTWQGFCNFIDTASSAVWEWRKQRDDLREVLGRIDDVMFAQKFEGAAAGLLNPGIIARELGLADKKEVSGPGAGPVSFTIEPVKSGTFLPPED